MKNVNTLIGKRVKMGRSLIGREGEDKGKGGGGEGCERGGGG